LQTVVHIVDDDDAFRAAVSQLLRTCGYEVVSYATAKQILDQPPDQSTPSCILLDVKMPGFSGPELQDRLAKMGVSIPIVFLTGHGDIPTSVHAIKAGAEDFLTKPVKKAKLLGAIERAIAGYQSSQEQHNRVITARDLIARLTPREREVFELVVRGKMNKQIAHVLGSTERTIKAHRQKVMEKTQVESLAELVGIAARLGILSVPADAPQSPQSKQHSE
jgi:FixJ family two-component response regulator